ncbi:MAG: KGGVGR-motif variant AAA ATPase, partial [Chloroflexota bacterium]
MPARVITLYSFKGGVGRTILAANLAAVFADPRRGARGGKTLLWDLDLEAPGLHHIPELRPLRPPARGFIDWIAAWQESGSTLPVPSEAMAELLELVLPTPINDALHILPAIGTISSDGSAYERVNWASMFTVQWPALFELHQGPGLAVFRQIIAALELNGFETILLDSRTGITDVGGMLTAALPHVTVLVGNYGVQNTYGLSYVWRALNRFAERPSEARGPLPLLRRLLVASPIPFDDPQARIEGKKTWSNASLPTAKLVDIPFDSSLLFSEKLLVVQQPAHPVARSYLEIADQIDQLTGEAEDDLLAGKESDRLRLDIQQRPGGVSLTPHPSEVYRQRCATLLGLLDYSVQTRDSSTPEGVDLIVRKRVEFQDVTNLVVCRHRSRDVTQELVAHLANQAQAHHEGASLIRSMIIAPSFTPAATAAAEEHGVRLLTRAALEDELFDPRPYLRKLQAAFAGSELAQTYVDQLLLVGGEGEPRPLIEHAIKWVKGEGSKLWIVLGDYGTGKSAFVRKLAYELARLREDDESIPVPIAINLRDVRTEQTLDAVLREHLGATIGWHGNPEIIRYLLASGRCVLLLDSFDE